MRSWDCQGEGEGGGVSPNPSMCLTEVAGRETTFLEYPGAALLGGRGGVGEQY